MSQNLDANRNYRYGIIEESMLRNYLRKINSYSKVNGYLEWNSQD